MPPMGGAQLFGTLVRAALHTFLPPPCWRARHSRRRRSPTIPIARSHRRSLRRGRLRRFPGTLDRGGLPKRRWAIRLVENRSGASGNVGTVAVARSSPDGYTLLVNTSSFIVNRAYSSLRPSIRSPTSSDRRYRGSATAIAANKNAGIATVAEHRQAGKRRPAKIELQHRRFGLDAAPDDGAAGSEPSQHHAFLAGGGPAMQAAVAGDATHLRALNVFAQLKAACSGVSPSPRPSAARSTGPDHDRIGLSRFRHGTTHLLVAPAGTPRPIVERLATRRSPSSPTRHVGKSAGRVRADCRRTGPARGASPRGAGGASSSSRPGFRRYSV